MIQYYQNIYLSGSGVETHNELTEILIHRVVNMAHTMMLHAAMHSPEGKIKSDLLSMAM